MDYRHALVFCTNAAIFNVFLAFISYKYIEIPLRHAKWASNNLRSIGCGLTACLSSALFCFIILTNQSMLVLIADNPQHTIPSTIPLKNSGLPYSPTCVVDNNKRLLNARTFDLCTVLPKQKNAKMIWTMGDSHAGHLQGLLYALNEKLGVGVHLIETPGIAFPVQRGAESKSRDLIYEKIKERLHPGDIVLISRLFLDRTDWKKTQNLSDWIADVLTLAKELSSQGVNLVIIGPPPHFNFEDISLCKSYKWKKSSCDIARDSIYTQIQEIYTEIKQKTKNTKNIYTFNQFNILCPQTHKQCSAFYNGVPIFKDSDHLNPLGSAILANPFIKFLDKQALI